MAQKEEEREIQATQYKRFTAERDRLKKQFEKIKYLLCCTKKYKTVDGQIVKEFPNGLIVPVSDSECENTHGNMRM